MYLDYHHHRCCLSDEVEQIWRKWHRQVDDSETLQINPPQREVILIKVSAPAKRAELLAIQPFRATVVNWLQAPSPCRAGNVQLSCVSFVIWD